MRHEDFNMKENGFVRHLAAFHKVTDMWTAYYKAYQDKEGLGYR